MRLLALLALTVLGGACMMRVEDIQMREPVRTMNFTGSHREIAYCVQQGLRGRLTQEAFNDAYVIYDSVKGTQNYDGISHYSVTIAASGPDRGIASVRVVFIPETPEMARERRRRVNAGDIRVSPVEKYWGWVESCVQQVNAQRKG